MKLTKISMNYSDKIIKNLYYPSCKNCIYYKPTSYDKDFTSQFNKCEKIGEKDIVSDKIKYDFATSCRSDETKCGTEAKYFVEEKNLNIKMLKHKIRNSYGLLFLLGMVVTYIFQSISFYIKNN